MACNSCAKPFSLLRKEKGCPSCGFSYCSKCLEHKIFVPKLNADAKVCTKCKNVTNSNAPKIIEPPDTYYRRVEALNSDERANSKQHLKIDNNADKEIVERLRKVQEEGKTSTKSTAEDEIARRLKNIKDPLPVVTDEELHERLARLRGLPTQALQSKPVLIAPDNRTEQEQADDLLKQYLEQTKIDTKYKDEFNELVNDIESRVQKLKGTATPGTSNTAPIIESEDEEETVKKLVEKIKSEASIEDISPSTNDELPFCEICNEDAKMRCLGCKYLFCKRCFMDHKDDDDGCNTYELYP